MRRSRVRGSASEGNGRCRCITSLHAEPSCSFLAEHWKETARLLVPAAAAAAMAQFFSLTDCEVIAFDLDHTLCRYNLVESARVSGAVGWRAARISSASSNGRQGPVGLLNAIDPPGYDDRMAGQLRRASLGLAEWLLRVRRRRRRIYSRF